MFFPSEKGAQPTRFFLTFPDPEHKKKVLVGEHAYAALQARVSADAKEGNEVEHEDVENLALFSWLAAPGSEAAIQQLLKDFLIKGKAAKKSKTESAATSSSSAAGSAEMVARKNAGKAAAMRYFA